MEIIIVKETKKQIEYITINSNSSNTLYEYKVDDDYGYSSTKYSSFNKYSFIKYLENINTSKSIIKSIKNK